MKYILTILLLIFLLFSVGLNVYFIKEKIASMTVVEVVDGDTFQLASGKRVRLLGIDAPEYNRCGGNEARELLKKTILNKPVILTEEMQETFGRSMALTYTTKFFFLKDQFVNRIIMENGWSRPDYRANTQREILTAAFHKAKDNNLGIWGPLCRSTNSTDLTDLTDSTTSTNKCLIKGNIDKSSYKKYYHLPNCKQYNQIILEKDIGEQYFCTEGEATRAGFLKSQGCP